MILSQVDSLTSLSSAEATELCVRVLCGYAKSDGFRVSRPCRTIATRFAFSSKRSAWHGVYLAAVSSGLGSTASRGGLVSLSFHRIKFPEPFPIAVNL